MNQVVLITFLVACAAFGVIVFFVGRHNNARIRALKSSLLELAGDAEKAGNIGLAFSLRAEHARLSIYC